MRFIRTKTSLAFSHSLHRSAKAASCLLFAAAFLAAPARAQKQWNVVPEKSTFQIELGKSGWLRALGDEHLIDVAEYQFKVQFDPSAPAGGSVTLVIPARALRVRDPNLSPADRLKVQEKMEGPEVLDIAHFKEIRLVARQVTAGDAGLYRIQGDLIIRGSVRSVAFDLRLEPQADSYRARGVVPVKMTGFGIEPPSAGAGGIRVKDEMRVSFDLFLAPQKR